MFLKNIENEDYKKLIDVIAIYSNRISVTTSINDEFETHQFYKKFKQQLISAVVTKKWPGTISTSKSIMYNYTFDRDIKHYLKQYNQFYHTIHEDEYKWNESLTGIDADISFFKNDELIFYTTTHEGTIAVIKEDLKGYIQKNLKDSINYY